MFDLYLSILLGTFYWQVFILSHLSCFFAQKISDDRYKFLTGTDHAIPHLYDINTFQCYLSSNIPETSPSGAINQACNYLFISITNCELPNTTVMLIISLSDS